MKKLLGILFLSLLLSGNSFAAKIVKLTKDVSSGSKFYKSLTGKYYKKYGYQIVSKEDGHPVRAGNQSIRFEVRQGDCGRDPGSWSDCKNDRERHELSGGQSHMTKGEYWFSWSIYFPKDHVNLFPLSNAYGQFHQINGAPVFMFKQLKDGYTIVRTIGDEDHDTKLLVKNKEMPGNWIDVLINAKWTKKKDGFFKIWINDELKYDYVGPTKSKSKVYQKFGVYSTSLTAYYNFKNIEFIEKCLNEKGWPAQTKKTFKKLKKGWVLNIKRSIKLHEVCKDFYKPVDIPNRIVYFDEVRRGKTKDKVGVFK